MRFITPNEKPHRVHLIGASILFLAMLANACGSGSSPGTGGSGGTAGSGAAAGSGGAAGSAGSMNGNWTISSGTCNGAAMTFGGAVTTFTINGSSGSTATTINTGGSAGACTITTALTLAFPAVGSMTWTDGATTCSPASCAGATYCSASSSGLQYVGTYVIAGNQLTFTMATVPTGDPTCPGGSEVLVLQKQ